MAIYAKYIDVLICHLYIFFDCKSYLSSMSFANIFCLFVCFVLFFFFETEFCSFLPVCSTMAQSRLTATSISQVQAIVLPQPPK